MMRLLAIASLACLCWPAVSAADIDCKDKYEANEPIVVKVTITGVPDGARMRGSFTVSGKHGIWQPNPQVAEYGVWAEGGSHTLTATGIWVLTRDVKIGEEVVPILVDFGQYSYSKTITVAGGDGPPPPPPPSGKFRIVLFYSEQQLDNLPQPQRDILTSLVFRKWLETEGHVLLAVDDPGNFSGSSPEQWKTWVQAALNKPLPLVALAPKDKGGYVTTYDLPASVDAMKALLRDPSVQKAVMTK